GPNVVQAHSKPDASGTRTCFIASQHARPNAWLPGKPGSGRHRISGLDSITSLARPTMSDKVKHKSKHIKLTSHPGSTKPIPITWGAADPKTRGPVIATLTNPDHRN